MKKNKFGEIRLNSESWRHVIDCLMNNSLTMGPKVKQFEEEWAKICHCQYAVTTNSGTSAIICAALALREYLPSRETEIICPALSFISSATALVAAGYKIRFVDVKRETLNINENLIEQNINKNTGAILAVNLMGKPCDIKKIREICDKYKLWLIADCCESHGCSVNGQSMEDFANMCVYSFFAAHIAFSVEQGAITTNNPNLDKYLRMVRNHGRDPKSDYFDHPLMGGNYKPTDLHAAIGLGDLKQYWENFFIRRENVFRFRQKLKPIEHLVWFSEEENNEVNTPHGFSITLRDDTYNINDLMYYLENNNIQVKRNFGSIPTQHKAFEYLGYKLGEFPKAEWVGNHGCHWGVHRFLKKEQIDYIAEKVLSFFGFIY